MFFYYVYIFLKEPPQPVHYAQDYVLSGPRQSIAQFSASAFFNTVVGVEGRRYIENSIQYSDMALFLANWELDLVHLGIFL